MSDLAPFLAAAIRDKNVMDLQEELRIERETNWKLQQELRVIRVTGPGGFPVYAERHFQYAKNRHNGEWLELQNSTGEHINPNLANCPVEDIEKCELHIGGKEILKIGDFNQSGSIRLIGDPRCTLMYFFGDLSNGLYAYTLFVDFGPVPNPEQAEVLAPEEYRNSGVAFVRFSKFQSLEHPFRNQTSSIVEGDTYA